MSVKMLTYQSYFIKRDSSQQVNNKGFLDIIFSNELGVGNFFTICWIVVSCPESCYDIKKEKKVDDRVKEDEERAFHNLKSKSLSLQEVQTQLQMGSHNNSILQE